MKTVKNLVDDAKKRTVLAVVWVVGLAYLMSLTSHSVWINIPSAILIIALTRLLYSEVQIRWRTYPLPTKSRGRRRTRQLSPHDPLLSTSSYAVMELWRRGVDSPDIEAEFDKFTKALVKEWVTDLWFSSVSADTEFPDELCALINGVFGEISLRARRINLITLLSQDIVDLVGNHLELFRRTQARVGVDLLGVLSTQERDENLRQALAATGELHPALVSSENEYKVLHQLMGGVVATVLKPEDRQCKGLVSLARELLACVVMRPVMNFASPGFINLLIENLVAQANSPPRSEPPCPKSTKRVPDRIPAPVPGNEDPMVGLEMVAVVPQTTPSSDGKVDSSALKVSPDQAGTKPSSVFEELHGVSSKSPGLRSQGSIESKPGSPGIRDARKAGGTVAKRPDGLFALPEQPSLSKGNWAQVLEAVNQRKTLALAPEHLDNLWTKGRNYKKRDLSKNVRSREPLLVEGQQKGVEKQGALRNLDVMQRPASSQNPEGSLGGRDLEIDQVEKNSAKLADSDKGLRRSWSGGGEPDGWQFEHKQSGFASFPGAAEKSILDIDFAPRTDDKACIQSVLNSRVDHASLAEQYRGNFLQCDVVGAHYEKNGSKTFAVYSIYVTDSQNRTWEVQRRFRHFEQLHRSVKDKPFYYLSLPGKRYLSSNLDNNFIRQRCVLLDQYLKDLLSIPSIAELHEVCDFLSSNSENYAFGESPSMIKTITLNVDDVVDDMFRQFRGVSDDVKGKWRTATARAVLGMTNPSLGSFAPGLVPSDLPANTVKVPVIEKKVNQRMLWEEESEFIPGEGPRDLRLGWHSEVDQKPTTQPSTSSLLGSDPGMPDTLKEGSIYEGRQERSLSEGHSPVGSLADSEMTDEDSLGIPPDWSPPKMSVPLLNLVDIIFQLQGRGWIRRQVFWIAKQVLQLGMGDAMDDWLLAKIQWLRREDVVASGIRWVHGVLWPDGIFVTKHPAHLENHIKEGSFEHRLEAARRAGVVREAILDHAPGGLVSLLGRKQYDRCAKDIYFFLQSTVCIKQLAFSLLEMLLLAAFPELQDLVLEVRNF